MCERELGVREGKKFMGKHSVVGNMGFRAQDRGRVWEYGFGSHQHIDGR